VSPLRGRSAKNWARATFVLLALLAPVLFFTSSATAAGNPTVARYLLPNPVPAWTSSPLLSETVAAGLQKGIGASVPGVLVASDGWLSTSGELAVALVVLPHAMPYSVSDGVTQGCEGVVNSGASPVKAIPGIASSGEGICLRKSGGHFVVEAAWSRGSTLAIVVAAGLSERSVNVISRQQDALLPPTGIHVQSAPASTISATSAPVAGAGGHTSNGVPFWALLAAGALIVALAVALALVVRSRRSKPSIVTPAWQGSTAPVGNGGAWQDGGLSSTVPEGYLPGARQSGPLPGLQQGAWHPDPADQARPAGQAQYGSPGAEAAPVGAGVAVMPELPAAPGWHPVGGDPHFVRYWDGSAWTAEKHWDGQNWIDRV
jgi:hypothetical protein